MWLPTNVYDKAPHYWLLLGFLFIVVGAYFGFQDNRPCMFAGMVIGICCCVWGFLVLAKRSKGSEDEVSGEV